MDGRAEVDSESLSLENEAPPGIPSVLVVRKLFDSGRYVECADIIREKQNNGERIGSDEWYRLALSIHFTHGAHSESMAAFEKAEALGFNQYWICYWRAHRLLDEGLAEPALKDAINALAISPTESAVALYDRAMDAVLKASSDDSATGLAIKGLYLRLRELDRRLSATDSRGGA